MLSRELKRLFVVSHIIIFEYLSNVTKTASKNVVCKQENKTRPRQPLVSEQTARPKLAPLVEPLLLVILSNVLKAPYILSQMTHMKA